MAFSRTDGFDHASTTPRPGRAPLPTFVGETVTNVDEPPPSTVWPEIGRAFTLVRPEAS
jgi:hypothetical protein